MRVKKNTACMNNAALSFECQTAPSQIIMCIVTSAGDGVRNKTHKKKSERNIHKSTPIYMHALCNRPATFVVRSRQLEMQFSRRTQLNQLASQFRGLT